MNITFRKKKNWGERRVTDVVTGEWRRDMQQFRGGLNELVGDNQTLTQT